MKEETVAMLVHVPVAVRNWVRLQACLENCTMREYIVKLVLDRKQQQEKELNTPYDEVDPVEDFS